MRAKGPFVVRKYQNLGYTDVCIRAPDRQPRVLTVHDGQHNIKATAAFFASCEEMYAACKALAPIRATVTQAISKLMAASGVPVEKAAPVLDAIDKAFIAANEAVVKADTPVEDIPGEPATSDPTYEQLIHAFSGIRRIVGGGVDEEGSGGPEALQDINRIVEILDGLQPEALKAEPDPVEQS